MTVYAATETEMGATTAKFSRLNGYYVVAETAQKAVEAVRAARPFFAGVWGYAEILTPANRPDIPANRDATLIHPDQLYYSVKRHGWCYRPESLLDSRHAEELRSVRRFLEIPESLRAGYPAMRRTPIPGFSVSAAPEPGPAQAERVMSAVADLRARKIRIRRGN